jgi:phosphoribosylpyrophosphate synthetase
MNGRTIKIIDGSANTDLTEKICKLLSVDKSSTIVSQFSDGESRIEIKENMTKNTKSQILNVNLICFSLRTI